MPSPSFLLTFLKHFLSDERDKAGAQKRGGGKAALFEQLKDIQPGEHGAASYAEIGVRLGLAEGTIASAMHRLRKRHREILREEIAHTVARPEEIDEEIRNLLAVLTR